VLKDYILKQLSVLTEWNNCYVEEGADGAITLIVPMHLDNTYVTVNIDGAVAGWSKKRTNQNDYSISFHIMPISDMQINIEVYSRGIIAYAMLEQKCISNNPVWVFSNFNNTINAFNYADYPYIQFTASYNESNQFTGFIAYYIGLIKKLINDEPYDFTDNATYDSEPEYHNLAPDGDLIITISDKTFNMLKKLGYGIRLSDGTLLHITKSMLGKKIIRKDSEPTVFYPLNESDFVG
jgi:hypothetical protein